MENILRNIISNPKFTQGSAWRQRDFKTNEVIVSQGETGHSLFLVEAGVLRVTGHVELEEHKNIQTGFCELEKDSIFGEACLYQSCQRIATIIAVTDGRVIEVDGQMLRTFLDANPDLGYQLYKKFFEIFVARLNKSNQRIEHLLAWGLKVHEIDKYL